jgi:hypothetical protein
MERPTSDITHCEWNDAGGSLRAVPVEPTGQSREFSSTAVWNQSFSMLLDSAVRLQSDIYSPLLKSLVRQISEDRLRLKIIGHATGPVRLQQYVLRFNRRFSWDDPRSLAICGFDIRPASSGRISDPQTIFV